MSECVCVTGSATDTRISRGGNGRIQSHSSTSKQKTHERDRRRKRLFFHLEAVSWARRLPIGGGARRGSEGRLRLAAVEEAGLDAAQGAEHPGMLAADLPLELIPLAGDHVKDILQACGARDIQNGRRGDERERGRARWRIRGVDKEQRQ